MQSARGVEVHAFARLEHGLRHGNHSGQMVDLVNAAHGFVELGAIQNRTFDQGVLESRQVTAVARAEIIEDDNLGLTLEMFDDV